MGLDEQEALRQLELAEAELAALKQELVLQHLIDTDEPNSEAATQLARLRQAVGKLLDCRDTDGEA